MSCLWRNPALSVVHYARDIRAARVVWYRAVVAAMLTEVPLPARERLLLRAVEGWHRPTRDQYLSYLHEFVRWGLAAGIPCPSTGTFPWVHLLQFTDYML